MPRSPTTQGSASSPSRVPPRSQSPRWHGDPLHRPPTDAEVAKTNRRNRSLLRFASFIAILALFAFVLAPTSILEAFQHVPPTAAPVAANVGWWLEVSYPWVKAALLALLGITLLWLCVGAGILICQVQQRRKAVLQTLLVDLPRTATAELGRGVDLFAGIGELLRATGSVWGNEEVLVFALLNNAEDNKVRLALRCPARRASQTHYAEALRNLVAGVAPGATTRPAPDDVQSTLALSHSSGFIGYTDVVLARSPSYPLKDLAMFVGGDPIGPLAAALGRQEGVSYAAYELILRALPPKEDWRAPLRERIGQIQGTVNPEDIAAYEALIRKVESHGFDVVIRCIVRGDSHTAVLQQLRTMQSALQTFNRPSGDARQGLLRVHSRVPGRTPGMVVIPPTATANPTSPTILPLIAVFAAGFVAAMLCGLAGYLLAQTALAFRASLGPLPFLIIAPPDNVSITALTGLCALSGLLGALASAPRTRAARRRARLATVCAHAHHFVWPGYRWTWFPTPGKHRSILGPYELAALWHPPSIEFDAQFAWRSSKYLPAPVSAFLSPTEASGAEHRRVSGRPDSARKLGASRLGIAYAQQRDGSLQLIGPTLRDLRQGWDTMGSMGSGKSSLVETMVYEIARLGGGCGVIDAKGDLSDRLLRILPPEAYERVIVIDTTAASVPCINPFDHRIIGTKPRDVVAGEIGQIFARIEPEIWAGALGMQQALFMGVSAILEGEPTPTMLHLERFYLSPTYRDEVLARVYDKAVRDYWLVQVPAMPEKIKTSIDSLKRRLTGLVGSETGQRLLCQPHSTIDLTETMRKQAILIIKFVPEKIGDTNAAFWGAALFQSIVSATFNQQDQTDPDERWDWPLFVDEVQMFVKADRAEDAERMWTRTRSMGVGLIGAHQGLNQLGDKLGGIVLNVIGSMCLTSGVRDDTHDLVNAYANQGLQPEDFTGVRPREELLLRFPVQSRDMGLMSAIPRERPPEQPAPSVYQLPTLPKYQPTTPDEAIDLLTLEALEQGVAAACTNQPDLLPETVYRAIGNEWAVAMHADITASLRAAEPQLRVEQVDRQAWAVVSDLASRLRRISERRAQVWFETLGQQPRSLLAHEYLTLLSEYRYGVNPLINACYVAALVHRYATDELTMAQHDRQRKQREQARTASIPPVQPPSVPGAPQAAQGAK